MQTTPKFKSLPALILALCPLVAGAQTSVPINVNANASISLAGYPPSQLMFQPTTYGIKWGTGAVPSAVIIPAGATSVTFAITGGSLLSLNTGTCIAPCITLDFNGGNLLSDADGVGWAFSLNLKHHGAISGIKAPVGGFVAGVFEAGGTPTGTPPPSLDFTASGLGTNFLTLSPVLNQIFYIGDGLTGDGTGTVQTFFIPSGATLLYLGIPDQCQSNGPTGCHADNSGVFVVTCTFT
jgi:hypothetical protein